MIIVAINVNIQLFLEGVIIAKEVPMIVNKLFFNCSVEAFNKGVAFWVSWVIVEVSNMFFFYEVREIFFKFGAIVCLDAFHFKRGVGFKVFKEVFGLHTA